MTPDFINSDIEIEVQQYPSLTYRLNMQNKALEERIDDIPSIIQACNKILATERYSSVIYSGKYGVELECLIGQNIDYIKTVLPRNIEEALMVDDRVQGIRDFTINQTTPDSLNIQFLVKTNTGEFTMSKEVTIK